MQKVILAGNGITAEILYAYLQQDTRYEVIACVVDDAYVDSASCKEIPSLGLSELMTKHAPDTCRVIMAMGYDNINRTRESMFTKLKELGYTMETYVHPDAMIYTANPLGEGAIILPGAVLEPYTSVGANTLVWAHVTVAHHATVEDHCWLASGAVLSGKAVVKRNTFVGVNATIVNEVEIGEYNIVGAGALMTKCTAAKVVHLARSGEPFRYSSEEYVKFFGV